ncbi:unnamed protein product [Mytilus edulis]|uniref:C1q domain-containing protein n=1 Tax=Mytilus edulis TaxID=6550 RepID=A0A8S3S8R3_MYTED|nr:unnamed protein product [Mytilus edulis]
MVKTLVCFLLLLVIHVGSCDVNEYQEMLSIVQNKMRVEFEEIWKHQETQDKRIHELELTIVNQNKQIQNLKRRCIDKEMNYLNRLFSQMINQNFKSEQLVGPKNNKSDVLKTQTMEMINKDGKTSLTSRGNVVNNEISDRDNYRKRRQMNTDSANTIAFYAYMNTHEENPGQHQTLIFDAVKTNLGSFYSKHSGVFTTPEQGTYVFTWSIISDFNTGYIFTEIVINSVPFGSILSNSEEVHDDHTTTGIVVAQLNKGDLVFIRTNPNASIKGRILSDSFRRSSFSGWKIM